MKAKIIECGNGLADRGDYASGTDGMLYRVVSVSTTIHTGPPGSGNYVYGDVELADWDDVTDEEADDITCVARVDDE